MLRPLISIVGMFVIGWAGTSAAAPCAGFTDVDSTSPFCANVAWMKNRGVTLGCTATQYCPDGPTTRLQMAAFMNRLANNAVFQRDGNAWGETAVLGTTDAQAVEVIVGGSRVMRYHTNSVGSSTSPNVIGGNPVNAVSPGVRGATIGGGGAAPGDTDPDFTLEGPNVVTDAYGTVGGGYNNRAGDNANLPVDRPFATVAGGAFNVASGTYAAIGGGGGNQAQDNYATVAGGEGNVAQGRHGSVGGGFQNTAKAFWSTVGGGASNVAGGATSVSGTYSTVGGGQFNEAAAGHSTVGGGLGNKARGLYGTVSGGLSNEANGDYSVAMGRYARVNGSGSFLFVDGVSGNFVSPVTSNTVNEFAVVASGGIILSTTANFSNNCRLSAGGGSWACFSDRRGKRDFAPVDASAILFKVVALPITTWRFQTQPAEIRHMGPMAQDFREAFGLGTDDKSITQVDVNGVALAAIQGLNAKLEATVAEQARENARLRSELADLRSLKEEVASIRAALSRDNVANR